MAAKKTSKKRETASNFIRAQPADMSTADVVTAGKKAGFSISSALVYKVRRRLKNPAGAAKGSRKKHARTVESAASAATSPPQTKTKRSGKADEEPVGQLESAFMELVADLGIRRAEQLLISFRNSVRDSVRDALHGR